MPQTGRPPSCHPSCQSSDHMAKGPGGKGYPVERKWNIFFFVKDDDSTVPKYKFGSTTVSKLACLSTGGCLNGISTLAPIFWISDIIWYVARPPSDISDLDFAEAPGELQSGSSRSSTWSCLVEAMTIYQWNPQKIHFTTCCVWDYLGVQNSNETNGPCHFPAVALLPHQARCSARLWV